jgi:hypothetical protein
VCIVVQGFPGAGIKPGLSGVAWVRRQERGDGMETTSEQPWIGVGKNQIVDADVEKKQLERGIEALVSIYGKDAVRDAVAFRAIAALEAVAIKALEIAKEAMRRDDDRQP